MKKRIISFFTALSLTLMLFTGIPISVSAAIGSLASDGYQLDDNGKLTIATDAGMTTWGSLLSANVSNAESVKNIEIKSGVTFIGKYAFTFCSSATPITIPNSVTSIKSYAFNKYKSSSPIIIPENVNSIDSAAFQGAKFTSIMILNSSTTFGGRPFNNYTSGAIIYPSDLNVSNTGIGTTQAKYTKNGNKLQITEITYGEASLKVTITDDMNINFVAESERTKVSQSGHTHLGGTATCKDKAKCEICNAEHGDKLTTHTWNSGTVTTAATCIANGVKTFTCTTCGATKTEAIAALGHSWSTTWSSDGNSHWYACTRSGCTATSGKTAHSGGTATCQTMATCSVCGTKYGSLGLHSYATTWEKSVTQHWHKCTTSGCTSKSGIANHTFVQKSDDTNHWQECSVCGDKKDETAHSWGNWTLTTEPTLNTTGTAERTCSCGEKQTKADVPALSNTTVWTKGDRTDPTVDAEGSQKYTSDYGDVTITIPQLSNTSVWTKVHNEPTEEAEGSDVYTSTDYGTVTVTIPKKEHTHDWGDWSITANPTLTTTGTAKRACTKDGTHTETKELPVLTDTMVWTITEHVDPTEEDTGKDVYTSEYGNVEVVLPKKEHTHDWGNWSITANPTLTTTGTAERACTKDSTHKETRELPVLTDTTVWTKDDGQHVEPTEEDTGKDVYTNEYGDVEVVLPKKEHTHVWSGTYQSDDGQHWKVCTKCSEAGTKENHAWDSGTVTTPPTEEAAGVKTFTCTVCSATKTESIAQLEHEHTYSAEWAKDETYHWYAATCGHDVVSGKAVHNWDSGIVTTEPTEEAAGVKTYTCTVCSATKTESIAQLEHKHTYSAEWTSNEISHWHAATCGHDVTSEAAMHTEDGGTVTTPPTTENDGEKTYACSVCGYVMRTVAIPKLDEDHTHSFSPDWKHDGTNHWHECDCGKKSDNSVHIENSGVVTTEPTEASTGIMTYSCKTCGYVIRTDIIPALIPEHTHSFGTDWKYDSVSHWHECECGEKSDIANHISSDWIVETPATVEAEGVQIKKCTVCGIELDREAIEKLPNISTGDVAEDVRDTAGTNAGLVQDNTLIENVLTPDDKTEVTEGHSFEIVLEVTDIRNSVSPTDVTAASSALKAEEKIGIYVDLSLFKIKDNIERTPIYNTNGQIGITLTIPESIYASNRTYSIIRVHNGIAENLGGTYDKTSRRLTFYTDKFSTYAIAYTASNGGTDRPSVPSTPPTGGTTPVSPSAPVVTPTVTETTVKEEEEVISDEPYIEDVSSAAGIYENGEADNNIHYVMILIFAAAAGIAAIATKKHFCKKNMK